MKAICLFSLLCYLFPMQVNSQQIRQEYCLGGIYEDAGMLPVEVPDGSMYFFHTINQTEPSYSGSLNALTKLENNVPVWTHTFRPVDSTWNEGYLGIIEPNGNHFTLLTNGRDKGRLCYRNLEDSVLWITDSIYGLIFISGIEKLSSGYLVTMGWARFALTLMLDESGQIKWQRMINYAEDFGISVGLFTFGIYNYEVAENPDNSLYLQQFIHYYDMDPFDKYITIKSIIDSSGQLIRADTSMKRIYVPSNITTKAFANLTDFYTRIHSRYYAEFYLPGPYQQDTLLVKVTDTRTLDIAITDTITGTFYSLPVQHQQMLTDSTLFLVGLRMNDSIYSEPNQYETHVFNPGVRAYDNQGKRVWEIVLPMRVTIPPFLDLNLTYHVLDRNSYYLEFNDFETRYYIHALVRDGQLLWSASISDSLMVNGLPYKRTFNGHSFFNNYYAHDSPANITPTHIYRLYTYQYYNPLRDSLDERYYYQRIDRQTGQIDKLGILDPEQYPSYYYDPDGPLIINQLVFHKRLNDSAFLLINNCNYCCSFGERDLHIVTATFSETATAIPINNVQNRTMRIFPNPNSGEFTLVVEQPNAGEIQIELVNLAGQVVIRKTIPFSGGDFHPVDVSGIPRGFYMLKMIRAGNLQSLPVVIQ